MKNIGTRYIIGIFRSKYCLAVLIFSLALGYYLIPKTIFYRWDRLLGYAFILSFALTTTCIVRNTKEKIVLAKTYKSSLASIIAIAVGLAALQACGVGAPVCGAAIGLGVLSFIFPSILIEKMGQYAVSIIVFSIAFQLISLYFMNCFKKMVVAKESPKR